MIFRKYIPASLLCICVIGFIVGAWSLLMLRFEAGDIYCPYSSLRSDPLGTKALYESLDRLSTIDVSRNYRSISKLPDGQDKTLLFLDIHSCESDLIENEANEDSTDNDNKDIQDDSPKEQKPDCGSSCQNTAFSEPVTKQLLSFAKSGGRLVLVCIPGQHGRLFRSQSLAYSLKKSLSFSLRTTNTGIAKESSKAERVSEAPRIEPELQWHLNYYFDNLAEEWAIVYTVEDKPVVIERKLGKGSVILMGDGYPLSNEALSKSPASEFLAWLISRNHVIFEESHLGITHSPNIATLGRKYNLEFLLGSFLILAALFVWKNSCSFIPRDPTQREQHSGSQVTGKSVSEGLMNLLQKSIHPSKLLSVCLGEWKRANTASPRELELQSQIDQVIRQESSKPKRQQDSVSTYKEICRIVSKRKS